MIAAGTTGPAGSAIGRKKLELSKDVGDKDKTIDANKKSNGNNDSIKSSKVSKRTVKPFTAFEEAKMLPWQASLMLKLMRGVLPGRFSAGPDAAGTKEELSLANRGSRWTNTRSGKLLAACLNWVELGLQRLYNRFVMHRRTLVVGVKASIIALFALALLRRLGNWYKGMAEYEVLLDNTDYEYQAYGGCFNGIGSSLMSSMNLTSVSQHRYTHLMRRLVDSLDVPCFPIAMKSFAVETGRDVALLLEDMDIRMKDWRRRRHQLLRYSESNDQQGSDGDGAVSFNDDDAGLQWWGSDSALRRPAADATSSLRPSGDVPSSSDSGGGSTINTVGAAADSWECLDEEGAVLRGLQNGVTVLQARQMDACLRIARLEVLAAANMCEDLLVTWRARVAAKSQAFRLPLPRMFLSRIPGLDRGTRGDILSGLRRFVVARMGYGPARGGASGSGSGSGTARRGKTQSPLSGRGMSRARADKGAEKSLERRTAIRGGSQRLRNDSRKHTLWSSLHNLGRPHQPTNSTSSGAGPTAAVAALGSGPRGGARNDSADGSSVVDVSSDDIEGPATSSTSTTTATTTATPHDSNSAARPQPKPYPQVLLRHPRAFGAANQAAGWGWLGQTHSQSQAQSQSQSQGQATDGRYLTSTSRLAEALRARRLGAGSTSDGDGSGGDGQTIEEQWQAYSEEHEHESLLRDLNAREKVILLEGLQKGLYEVAGRLQRQLYLLDEIRCRLLVAEGGSAVADGTGAEASPEATTDASCGKTSSSSGGGILSEEADPVWRELDGWVAQSGQLCTHSLSLVMMAAEPRSSKAAEPGAPAVSSRRGPSSPSSPSSPTSPSPPDLVLPAGVFDRLVALVLPLNTTTGAPSADNNTVAVATASHSATAVVVSNFTLPAPPLDVLERCLLRGRSDAYSQAVQAEGDTVEAVQGWRAVGTDGLSVLSDGAAGAELAGNGSLWARTLTYTHHRAGGLLMGPSSSLHALQQLLLVAPAEAAARKTAASKAPPSNLSVLLAGFMDLSHVPYCQGCSYTTLLSLRPEHDADRNATTTRVTVTLDTAKGPSTLYQSLVTGGIKGGVVSLMEAWQRSARACLGVGKDPSAQPLPALSPEQVAVRGEGEQQLLRRLGRALATDVLLPSEESSSAVEDAYPYPTPAPNPADPVSRPGSGAPAAGPTQAAEAEETKGHPFWLFGRSQSPSPRPTAAAVESPELQLSRQWERQRAHWRRSKAVVTALQRAPPAFKDHLASIGLIRKRRTGLLGLLRLRVLLGAAFWSGVTVAAVEASKRSSDIAWAAEVARRNARDFIQRRLTTPTVSIMNDVILNRRVTILDKEALLDAKRSLSVMLNDFLTQHKPKLSENERRRLAQTMDMRQVSEEYEKELRRPIRSLVTGQIAKLVLIQLQFVKKELLEAMQVRLCAALCVLTAFVVFCLHTLFTYFSSRALSTPLRLSPVDLARPSTSCSTPTRSTCS